MELFEVGLNYGQNSMKRNIIIILSGVRLSPLSTAATTGLLYQPPMIDDGDCGEIGGWRLAKETEILGNLPQFHFVHYKSRMT
jgi:hypothetical protein